MTELKVLVICRDMDVTLLLVHFISAQRANICWVSQVVIQRQCLKAALSLNSHRHMRRIDSYLF